MLCDYILQDMLDPHGSYVEKREERVEGNLFLLAILFGEIPRGLLVNVVFFFFLFDFYKINKMFFIL